VYPPSSVRERDETDFNGLRPPLRYGLLEAGAKKFSKGQTEEYKIIPGARIL